MQNEDIKHYTWHIARSLHEPIVFTMNPKPLLSCSFTYITMSHTFTQVTMFKITDNSKPYSHLWEYFMILYNFWSVKFGYVPQQCSSIAYLCHSLRLELCTWHFIKANKRLTNLYLRIWNVSPHNKNVLIDMGFFQKMSILKKRFIPCLTIPFISVEKLYAYFLKYKPQRYPVDLLSVKYDYNCNLNRAEFGVDHSK